MRVMPLGLVVSSLNQRFPSGPVTMAPGSLPDGIGNWVMVPLGPSPPCAPRAAGVPPAPGAPPLPPPSGWTPPPPVPVAPSPLLPPTAGEPPPHDQLVPVHVQPPAPEGPPWLPLPDWLPPPLSPLPPPPLSPAVPAPQPPVTAKPSATSHEAQTCYCLIGYASSSAITPLVIESPR